MAERNQTLPMDLFSPRDLGVSRPARFDSRANGGEAQRFGSQNVKDKQGFAEVYSRSLRHQARNEEAKNAPLAEKSARFSTSQTKPTKAPKSPEAKTVEASPRPPSTQVKAENGKPLPHDRIEQWQGSKSAGETKDATTLQVTSQPITDEPETLYSPSFQRGLPAQEPVEVAELAAFEISLFDLGKPAADTVVSQPNSTPLPEPLITDPVTTGSVSSVNSVLGSDAEKSPSPSPTQNSAASPVITAASAAISTQPPMAQATPAQGIGVEASTPQTQTEAVQTPAPQGAPAAGEQDDSPALSKPAGVLDALWRAAVAENGSQAAVISGRRFGNRGATSNSTMADLLTPVEKAQTVAAEEDAGDKVLKRETALFHDRLISLTQQAGAQAGNTSGDDFNRLLPRHASLLTPTAMEQPAIEGVHTLKEPLATVRTPSGSVHTLTQALPMFTSPDNKAWSDEVGHRLIWMAKANLQEAQLQLNPKHLGPLEVRISVSADQQVNVNFLTHSASVKEALDQAMPRLRDVFDNSGLNLNNVTVQQESHRQQHDQRHGRSHGGPPDSLLAENVHEEAHLAQIFQSQTAPAGIVDFYA